MRVLSVYSLLAHSILITALCLPLPAKAQSRFDGEIIPPVLRRHLPSQTMDNARVPFGAGEAVLPPAALGVLDRFADRMREQPRAKVILYGFADAQEYSNERAGSRLAQQRAEAARDYLLLRGLAVQGVRIEVVLPPATYNPPLKSTLPRPASYVEARLLAWDE